MCVLIAALFVASGWWLLSVRVPTKHGPYARVCLGSFAVALGLDEELAEPSQRLSPLPEWNLWNYWAAGSWVIAVPLYAMFAAALLTTTAVWRFVPKFPRGHCRRCGYNLTGLTKARCPECATGFDGNET